MFSLLKSVCDNLDFDLSFLSFIWTEYQSDNFEDTVWNLEWQKGATNTVKGLTKACMEAMEDARDGAQVKDYTIL